MPTSQAQQAAELLSRGPGDDPHGWALDVLGCAVQMEGEDSELARTAGGRVRALPGIGEHMAAVADLINDYFQPDRDFPTLLERVMRVARSGDPVTAVWGLRPISVRASHLGHRLHAELIALAGVAVLDRWDGMPGAEPADDADFGADTGAGIVRDVWSALRRQEWERLARIFSDGPLGETDDDVRQALDACAELVRTAQTRTPLNAPRVRAALLRRLSYCPRPLGSSRLAWYAEYAATRGVPPRERAAVYERWAQGLMGRGDLTRALAVLEDAPVFDGPASANMHRGRSRVWRYAGDYGRALEESDAALRHATEGPTSQTMLGNIWLNRAYALHSADRDADAFAAAAIALRHYEKSPYAVVGRSETQALMCASDPDPEQREQRCRRLLAADAEEPLPDPIRASALMYVAEGLQLIDRSAALEALRNAATTSGPGPRMTTRITQVAARLLLSEYESGRHPDALAEGLRWARQGFETATAQRDRLLTGQAGLVYARWLALTRTAPDEVSRVTRVALDELGHALAGLAAEPAGYLLGRLREDLFALFDAAVDAGDHRLALDIVEVGRAVRLTALLRLRPEEIPPEIRTALAALTVAERVQDGGQPEADEGTRAAAADAFVDQARAIDRIAGPIIRGLVADRPAPIDESRSAFRGADLLTLAERDGLLRWVWWPREAASPISGVHPLSPRTVRRLKAYATGMHAGVPGPIGPDLRELLPEPFVERVTSSPATRDVLVVPVGDLWRAPVPAIPVGADATPLCRRVRLTVTPSVSMAAAVVQEAGRRDAGVRQLAGGYCNPRLPGATAEHSVLVQQPDYIEWDSLDQAREAFVMPAGLQLGVLSTHGQPGVGLAQTMIDHHGRRLSAGEALLLEFPPVTSIPICYSLDAAEGDEPIGLATIVQARGATWVIGGYQQLKDETVGWILGRTYRLLQDGVHAIDALREAQAAYLDGVEAVRRGDPDVPAGLPEVINAVQGPSAALQPQCWALAIVGPPHPSTWRADPEGEAA